MRRARGDTSDRKIYRRAKVCTSKKAFGTREGALACQWSQLPYQCPICKKWHLTNSIVHRASLDAATADTGES
jgi:hypothetical protein